MSTEFPSAADTGLSLAEAQKISALLMEQMRRNGKLMLSLSQAVYALRATGRIAATRWDQQSGQAIDLSSREILQALRAWRLHPEQVRLSTARAGLNGDD